MNFKSKPQTGVGHVAIIGVIVVVGAVSFAGWRVLDNEDGSTSNSHSNSSQNENSVKDELSGDIASLKPISEIQTLAQTAANGADITGIELSTEDGKAVYVVQLSDATTGESAQTPSGHKGSDSSAPIPSNFVAGITIQQAIDSSSHDYDTDEDKDHGHERN